MKKTEYRNIIDHLLLEHKISVKRYRVSNSGRAIIKTRTVEIPDPKSIYSFITCIHEISHVLYDKTSYPVWKCEFSAITRAERFCKEHDIEIPNRVTQQNKFYLKAKLCKGFIRGLKIDNVDGNVLKYAGVDKRNWKPLLSQKIFLYLSNHIDMSKPIFASDAYFDSVINGFISKNNYWLFDSMFTEINRAKRNGKTSIRFRKIDFLELTS